MPNSNFSRIIFMHPNLLFSLIKIKAHYWENISKQLEMNLTSEVLNQEMEVFNL